MNQHTKSFLENMKSRCLGGFVRYQWRGGEAEETIRYLEGLSKNAFISIISDPYWNKYPSYKWKVADDAPIYFKPYGHHLSTVIRRMFEIRSCRTPLMIKKATGLILAYTLDGASGKDSLAAAKRGIKSDDVRARKRAIKILPASQIIKYRDDPDVAVRTIIVKRLGINNCSKHFVNDKNKHLRYLAIVATPLHLLNYQEILDEFIELSNKGRVWRRWDPRVKIVKSIVGRMDAEELIFYLNLSGNDQDIDDILSNKLEG